MKKSNLFKFLSPYKNRLIGWNVECDNDGCVDCVVMSKNDVKISFSEDLREHITNMVLMRGNSSLRVDFRFVSVHGDFVNVDVLQSGLHKLKRQNCVEKEEIFLYFCFFSSNKIL